jgi:hypothetical protein
MSNFALLETKRGKPNKIHRSAMQETTDQPHKYDPRIENNQAIGYVPVTYEHQDFPRMLYHPNWGKLAKPDMAKFAIGCITQDQFQQAFAAYQEAEQKWMRSNRVKLVESPEELERLEKKGWLLQPPLRKDNKQFDLNSDEI